MLAEVAVNVAGLSQTYHYRVPPHLPVQAGHLVVAPFAGRRAQAVVVALAEEADLDPAVRAKLATLEAWVDPEPALNRAQIDLAYWLAHTYLAPLTECLLMMLPPGLAQKADVLYTLAAAPRPPDLTALQQRVLELLAERGPLRGRQIDRALPKQNWRPAAEALARHGLLTKQPHLEPPTARAKHVRTARFVAPAPGALSRTASKDQRLRAILDFLRAEAKPVEVAWVYAAVPHSQLADLHDLAERGLVALDSEEVWRDPLAGQTFVAADPPTLTADQFAVWAQLRHALHTADTRPILLHGVTGSGKTEIYLRALAETLAQGQRALVLVPEIALTPQMVRRFAARFPGRVGVWHSELDDGERYDTWRRARLGLVDVVIGARSALFAPLPNLGLIVLDEEHDEAYKQDARLPYHAREAALEYARRVGAVCVLGSATPAITTYFRARRGEMRLLELPRRIMAHTRAIQAHTTALGLASPFALSDSPDALTLDLPPVQMVDMRQELRAGNTHIFSRALRAALAETLARGQQAILFLNRRGSATYVFCRDCGHSLQCPQCDLPLTFHRAGEQLRCHQCGHAQAQPALCPACASPRLKFFGLGTEKLLEVAQAEFPAATFARWDRDATRAKGAHDLILHHFQTHQVDVLIGTQMIAKGLDVPLVTLVGVVSADVGLNLPDYRAAERAFHTLTQVAGRAGRGALGGRAIFQTFMPEHYVIQAAARHDYAGFYQQELAYRKTLGYPPFKRLMRLVFRHADPARAEHEASVVAAQLRADIKRQPHPDTEVIGPAPCFFGKVAGSYRWQVLVRGPDPAAVVRGKPLKGWLVDVDALSTL